MATKRRKSRKSSRRSCKYGKLKRPVRTRRKSKRRRKKSKKRKIRRKYRMDIQQGPQGNCPPGMVEDFENCGSFTPCKDRYGICRSRRGFTLSEVQTLQELATRRLLRSNTQNLPHYTLHQSSLPPFASKGYYLRLPDGNKINIRSDDAMKDMEERDKIHKDLADALYNAVGYRADTEVVRMLLENGANPNITNRQGNTALVHAIMYRNTEIVQLLLNAGADPNIQNNDFTVLMIASERGNTEIVQLLLNAGADPNIQNNDGDTALMIAIRRCRRGRDGRCFPKNVKLVKLLIEEESANPNIQNNEGKTALIMVSGEGYTEIARMLLENGANPDIKDHQGGKALAYASSRGYTGTMVLLLDAGARSSYN